MPPVPGAASKNSQSFSPSYICIQPRPLMIIPTCRCIRQPALAAHCCKTRLVLLLWLHTQCDCWRTRLGTPTTCLFQCMYDVILLLSSSRAAADAQGQGRRRLRKSLRHTSPCCLRKRTKQWVVCLHRYTSPFSQLSLSMYIFVCLSVRVFLCDFFTFYFYNKSNFQAFSVLGVLTCAWSSSNPCASFGFTWAELLLDSSQHVTGAAFQLVRDCVISHGTVCLH